jgi:N-acetylglutamate synthase-like GNAT family acetyltransferase
MKMKGYSIKTEINDTHVPEIHALLKDSFWTKAIPPQYISQFLKHSLCFGVFMKPNMLVGFARAITDKTTYAYLCDVVIHADHQHQGLGKALLTQILKHPHLQGLKTISLQSTPQSVKLYQDLGFKPVSDPSSFLEISDLEIYTRAHATEKY